MFVIHMHAATTMRMKPVLSGKGTTSLMMPLFHSELDSVYDEIDEAKEKVKQTNPYVDNYRTDRGNGSPEYVDLDNDNGKSLLHETFTTPNDEMKPAEDEAAEATESNAVKLRQKDRDRPQYLSILY
jgi:hypothetical protein